MKELIKASTSLFSVRGTSFPRRHLAKSGDNFSCHNVNWQATWPGATEAAGSPTMHSTGPYNKASLLSNAHSAAEGEKPESTKTTVWFTKLIPISPAA